MTTIILLEPRALLRLGMQRILADIAPDVSIQGGDYTKLAQKRADSIVTDLVLLSIPSFQAAAGLIAATQRAYSPKAIILMAESESMLQMNEALPPSVAGYASTRAAPEVLQASVRLVLAGGTCFPPGAVNARPVRTSPVEGTSLELRIAPQHAGRRNGCVESELLGLTPRQYEVLVLLARGYPMKTVGRRLNISVATAKAHTETLYQRLDVHNRSAAVHKAISRGARLGWAVSSNGPSIMAEAHT